MAEQSHPPPDRELARLAARQHSVVAHWQIAELGLSPDGITTRVKAGRLHRIHRGVYAVGHPRLTLHGRYVAAVLAAGRHAVLSHASALALYDLRPRRAGPIDVTVPARGRRATLAGVRLHCVRALPAGDRTARHGIPVTTVARALLDYAEQAGRQELRLAIEAAERHELVDLGDLHAVIARGNGRRGASVLANALEALNGEAPDTRSELERTMLAFVREHGLPEPQTNVLVAGELVDCYWPGARLIVEVDSWLFHKTRNDFENDRRRDAKLQALGYVVIRVTARRLQREPKRVAGEIRSVLAKHLL